MPKADFLKQLAAELTAILPSHLGTLKKDFEKNCHSMLVSTLNKFDLVTREEFDTQTKVLARTRKKLDELEAHVQALETSLKTKRRHSSHD